jgi:hypothetical protein
MKHNQLTALVALLTFTLMAHMASASTLTLDFDTDSYGNTIQAGQFIDNEYANWGVNITANNQYGPDYAITFDTAHPTGNDNDLATPGYNNSANLGNVLILPTYITDANHDGYVDDPNDQAGNNPGYFLFTFDDNQSGDVSIDFLDIEESGGKVRFYLDGSFVSSYNINLVGDNGFGSLALTNVNYDQIKVSLAGSGGIDNLTFDTTTVPEPASMSLLAVGALMIGMRPKRKRAC